VDYSLYLLTTQLVFQRQGHSLGSAYRNALISTGKVVALIGVTLAAAVVTWAWSPIKFQADMGILLAFMFLWNMLGALILIPSLAAYLLPMGKSVKADTRAAAGKPHGGAAGTGIARTPKAVEGAHG
jgi:predicted RND superfamily exporter protein